MSWTLDTVLELPTTLLLISHEGEERTTCSVHAMFLVNLNGQFSRRYLILMLWYKIILNYWYSLFEDEHERQLLFT